MKAIEITTKISVTCAALVILAAGILGYTALFDLFVSIGLFAFWLGIFFPLLFDLAEVTAAVSVFNAKLQGEEDRFAWGMVLLFTALGVIANIAHATAAWMTGRIDTLQVILAIFATSLFPLSVALVTHLVKRVIARDIKRRGLVSTLAELTAQVDTRRADLDKLNGQIERAKLDNAILLTLDRYNGKNIKQTAKEWTELRRLIWERDKKECKRCHADLSAGQYHCHHILAEASGGRGEPSNLVTLCEGCHNQAHDNKLFVQSEGGALALARQIKQEKMSERRDKVLELLSNGHEAGDIAAALGVTVKTIRRDITALNGHAAAARGTL